MTIIYFLSGFILGWLACFVTTGLLVVISLHRNKSSIDAARVASEFASAAMHREIGTASRTMEQAGIPTIGSVQT